MQTTHEPRMERGGQPRRDADDEEAEDEADGVDEETLKPLGAEAPEVVDRGARIGARRLVRPLVGDAVTSFIGGMSVSFGAVAMAWGAASIGGGGGHVVGSLLFPVGFLILLLGKSELFTENFFLPVTAVLERRGTLRQLLAHWAVTLIGNLFGCLIFAFLISCRGVLDTGPASYIVDLAQEKVGAPLTTSFLQAIFAGWLMTLLTWLLLAVRGLGPRLVVIWAMGTLIVLGRFNHVIISASELFMAMLLGAPISVAGWLGANFLPALIGNVVGGTVFVTLLFYIQAQYHDSETLRRSRFGQRPDRRGA
jgi:formate/nitrite transporter FocA (FNT family)